MADGGGSIVWRFGIGGAEEGKRSLRDLGQAGVDAFQATGEAAAVASRKIADQSPAVQRLAQSYQALERARQAQQGFNSLTAPGLTNVPKSAEESAAAFEALGNKAGLTSMQVQELTAVVRHSFDALASGANPLTVVTQHAATTAQALGSGPGGVAGAVKTLFGLVGTWAPLAAGVGVLAALALAAKSYADEQKAANQELAGAGRTSGVSTTQIDAISAAAKARGDVSRSQARQIELGLLDSGGMSAASLGPASTAVAAYAKQIGDTKKALAELGPAFADPAKGAVDLATKYGLLDDATVRYVQRLVEQGEKERAQVVLANSVNHSLDQTRQHVDALGATVRFVTGLWEGMWEAAGRAMDRTIHGLPASERLASLHAELAEARAGGGKTVSLPDGSSTTLQARPEAQILADLASVQRQLTQEKNKRDTPKAQSDGAQAGALARRLSGADELDALRQQQSDLKAGLDSAGKGLTKLDDTGLVKDRYDAVTRAITTWMPAAKKAQEIDRVDAELAKAKTPVEKAALAAQRERLELSGKVMTGAEVEAQALAKGAKARAEAAKAGDKHAASLAREGLSLEVNAAGARAAATAYLKSTAAGEHADAVRKAATEATKKGESPEKRAARQSDLDDAESARDEGKAVAALRDQTAARRELDAAVSAGSITQAEAQRRLQDEATLRPYVAKLQNAQRQGETANIAIATAALKDHRAALAADHAEADAAAAGLRKIASKLSIEDIAYQARLSALAPGNASRAGIVRSHAETVARRANQPDAREAGQRAVDEDAARLAGDRTKFLSDATQQLDKQHDLSIAELATAAQSAGQRALELADFKARQDFKDRGLQADDKELAGYRERIRDQELLNQSLERANAYWSDLHGLQDSLGDAVGKMAEDMGDVNAQASDLLSVAKSIYAEWIKLALVNPLKNDLFHQNNPTISGGFGGLADFAKSILGGGQKGTADAALPWGVRGYATGTDDAPEGWAWVGENGPELRYLNRGTKIATHQRSMEMATAAATRPFVGAATAAGGGAPAIHLNDYRKAGSPPVRQRRGADGSTHFDIRDEFTRGVDGYVKSGALERSLRTTPSVATRRGA